MYLTPKNGIISTFAVFPMTGQTLASCSGSYFLKVTTNTDVDLLTSVNTTVDNTKSYHQAVKMS